MTTATNGPGVRDVDAAVKSVLADLFPRSPATPRDLRNGPAGRDGEVFAGRLLSLREAESLSPGVRLVRVAPGTVITPLARDHLRRLAVEVRIAGREELARGTNAGEWGVAIGVDSGLLQAFRRSILDGPEAWREVGTSADEAALWVRDGAARGALALTEEASVAVYQACQIPGVRAATAEEPVAVGRAVRALGVNLLVVEPEGKSLALLKQISAAFRREGCPVAPAWAVRKLPGGQP